MRIEYDNYLDRTTKLDPLPYFTTINKIVLKGEQQSDITMYYGSDESLLGLSDINEYGWEFLVDKYKHDDTDVLSLLPLAVKNNIGTSMSDLEMLRKALFPTLAGGETRQEPGDIEYFGTLSIGRQKLLIVRIPPAYSVAELWDTTDITKRIDYINPETGEIESTEYERYINDTTPSSSRRVAPEGLDTVETLLPKIKVMMDDDEITCTDLVWFVVSTGTTGQSNVSNINLSFLSWEETRNPHRNLHEYLLRNDDKAFIETATKVVEYDAILDQYMDEASGTLVGNERINNHPLLDRAISLAQENTEWDKYAIYDRGEKAMCKGTEYVSLIPRNRGNYPLWNPSTWMKADIMPTKQQCFGARRVFIKTLGTIPEAIGSIYPASVIIPSDVEEGIYKKFTITYSSKGVLQPSESDLIKFKDSLGNIQDNLLQEKQYQAFRYGGQKTEAWIDLHDLDEKAGNSDTVSITFTSATYPVKGIVVDEDAGTRTDLETVIYALGSSYVYTKNLLTGYTAVVDKIVKNYYIGATFLGSADVSDYFLTSGKKISIKEDMNVPASIVYEIYVKRLQYVLLISEYPGFIVDYVEKKVNVPDGLTETYSPASIKFRPVDGDFEKVVSVSAMWDNTWHDSVLSTSSIERMSYTAQGYNQTGQTVDTWLLKRKIDPVTGLQKYYEVEIPNVVKNITFKIV